MADTHFLYPGEILKMDYLEGYDVSVGKAAAAMNMMRARLNEIVIGKRGITPPTRPCAWPVFSAVSRSSG